MENKVCIYAISKNEAKFVDKWVKSMSEADEIVVLDTGSTDDTVEKLKKYPNVKVYQKEIKPWRFDVARNEAMKLASDECNIFFSTDLDEVLEPGWAKPLKEKWIDGVHERGTYKYAWSHNSDGTPGRIFKYDKIHSRNWVWKYPVHELLYNTKDNTEDYYSYNTLDLFNDIYLHHYPDRTKSRAGYLPLLKLRASEDPNDYYGLIYLAHEYTYRHHYDDALNIFNKILTDHLDELTNEEHASCYLFIGDIYTELKQYDKAEQSYIKSISIGKNYREPYLNLAKMYLNDDIKDYESAIFYIKKGIKNSYRHYTWLERDASWGAEPWDLLSIASFYNGNKKDSLAYSIKALSLDKNNDRLKDNLKSILDNSNDLDYL